MKTPHHLGAALCLLAHIFGGCRLLNDQAVVQGHSPLRPGRPSPDSVTMEIIWARFPAGDPALNTDAWREIDETQLPPSVQRELANNGLRAGVVGNLATISLKPPQKTLAGSEGVLAGVEPVPAVGVDRDDVRAELEEALRQAQSRSSEQRGAVAAAPGSRSRTLPVPGLAQHGIGFKTLGEATLIVVAVGGLRHEAHPRARSFPRPSPAA